MQSAHTAGHRPGWLQVWPSFTIACYAIGGWGDRHSVAGELEVVIVGPPFPGRPGEQLTERYRVASTDAGAAAARRRLTEVGDARQAAFAAASWPAPPPA